VQSNRTSLLTGRQPSRWRSLARLEWIGAAALAFVFLVWALLPAITQDPTYHRYADQRAWLGIPFAANVLSNAAFVVVGAAALFRLVSDSRDRSSPAAEFAMACVAIGVIGTAAGSAWYHLAPTNATLVWDRIPMTVVFAGIFATAVAQRIGERAALASLALLVPLGVASVVYWKASGDLSLYAALQFGGVGALALLVAFTRGARDPFPWIWVLAWYALAKIAESADRAAWDATRGFVSGHTLKHLLAALACAAALWPLLGPQRPSV
jgi:hypothetical protein